MKEIDSVQNPTIKRVVSYLEKSRERRKDNVFVVEGIRENSRAIEKNYLPQWIFFDKDQLDENQVRDLLNLRNSRVWFHACSSQVFSKISFRSNVANIVGVYEQKHIELESLELDTSNPVLVIEAIEKPGNLGAMLRTANAAGVKLVLVADGVLDIHHPQVIRNSLGGFFDLQLVTGSSTEIIHFLKSRDVQLVVSHLEGSVPHYSADLSIPSAIVMGAEDVGVTHQWVEASDVKVKIPMAGVVDSLNVSAAAAILLFESTRQREMK